MSDDSANSLPALPVTDADRDKLLARIWALQAAAFEAALKNNPSAATLTASRAFLADNGVNITSLRRAVHMTNEMQQMLAQVPTFADDDEAAPKRDDALSTTTTTPGAHPDLGDIPDFLDDANK